MNLNTEHPTGDELNAVSDGLLELSDDTLETLSGGNDRDLGGALNADQMLVGGEGLGEITVINNCNFCTIMSYSGVEMARVTDVDDRSGAADPLVAGRAPVPVPMSDGKKIDQFAPLTQNTREATRSTFLTVSSSR